MKQHDQKETQKHINAAYLGKDLVWFITDPLMNGGGIGIFFTRKGVTDYFNSNRQEFSRFAKIEASENINTVASLMLERKKKWNKTKKFISKNQKDNHVKFGQE